MVAAGLLFAAAAAAMSQVREGFQVIGHGAGPKVAASSDLYLALSDMDAQTANILLVGDTDQAEEAERIYDRRRGEAGAALVQAAQLAAGSGAEERNVREVIDGLGAYERLVTEARAAGTGDGEPSDEAVARYREATDLMRLELLPKAYNLTLDSGATVRATYEEKRAAVLAGAGWTAAAGLVAVAALGWHHRNLATRFRRRINPAVAAAAAGALLLAGTAAGTLLLQAERMREAKEDGLDSVLALSRAHAISTGMHGDQSRFLLDTGQADTYEQVYLDGARSVVFVEGRTSPPTPRSWRSRSAPTPTPNCSDCSAWRPPSPPRTAAGSAPPTCSTPTSPSSRPTRSSARSHATARTPRPWSSGWARPRRPTPPTSRPWPT
ncbi:hypothetical protein ACFQXA_22825 [Nocardiopsis composta]